MNLKTYLETNGREVGDLTNLFSVGTVLDTVSGDTFPMLAGGAIGFDETMNLMDMDISDDSFDWYNSLANSDKEVVDEVMDELAYEDIAIFGGDTGIDADYLSKNDKQHDKNAEIAEYDRKYWEEEE